MAGALKRFLPLFDRVLVQRVTAPTQTKAGILIPENIQKKEHIAKVVAIGQGVRTESGTIVPVAVQVGDEVYLPEFGGTKVVLEDTDYFLFRDSDFLAKIKKE